TAGPALVGNRRGPLAGGRLGSARLPGCFGPGRDSAALSAVAAVRATGSRAASARAGDSAARGGLALEAGRCPRTGHARLRHGPQGRAVRFYRHGEDQLLAPHRDESLPSPRPRSLLPDALVRRGAAAGRTLVSFSMVSPGCAHRRPGRATRLLRAAANSLVDAEVAAG